MWVIIHTIVFKVTNSIVDREDNEYNTTLDSTCLSTPIERVEL